MDINGKIEQIVDVVKDHLRSIIHEEFEGMSTKVMDLMEQVTLLQHENILLKFKIASATKEGESETETEINEHIREVIDSVKNHIQAVVRNEIYHLNKQIVALSVRLKELEAEKNQLLSLIPEETQNDNKNVECNY